MAYDQHNDYQAPSRQYMNNRPQGPQTYPQRPPQQQRPAYNDDYNGYGAQEQDGYGYDRGQQGGYQQGHDQYGGYEDYGNQYAQDNYRHDQQPPPPRQQYPQNGNSGMNPQQRRGPPPPRGRGGPPMRGGARGGPRGGAPQGPPRQDQSYAYDQGYDQGYAQPDPGYNESQYGGGRPPPQQQMNSRPPMPRQGSGGRPPLPRQASDGQRVPPRQQNQGYQDSNSFDNMGQRMPQQAPVDRRSPNGHNQPPHDGRQREAHQIPRKQPQSRMQQPLSPVGMSQDNAFPSFPVPTKPSSAPPAGGKSRSIEGQISNLKLDDSILDDDNMRPTTSASHRSKQSNGSMRTRKPNAFHDSGYQAGYAAQPDDYGMNGQYPNPGQHGHYAQQPSPPRQRRSPPRHLAEQPPQHPPQRPGTASGVRPQQTSYGDPQYGQGQFTDQGAMSIPQRMDQNPTPRAPQQQWAQAQINDGFHGPESPGFIPPRPATAGGTRAPPQSYTPAPEMPQAYELPNQTQPAVPPAQSARAHERKVSSVSDVLDDYYDSNEPASLTKTNSADARIEAEMPNFDAIPQERPGHRRNDTLHLTSPTADTTAAPPMPQLPPAQRGQQPSGNGNGFYQQAQMTRSQPDLRGAAQVQGQAFEMAGDMPALPPMPRNDMTPGPGGRGMPMAGRGGFGGPMRGGPRGMTPQPQAYNDGEFVAPPMRRGATDLQAWDASRGPGDRPSMDSQRPGGYGQGPQQPMDPRQQRSNGQGQYGPPQGPNGAAPPSNPDALPHHAVPVRPGLMDNQRPANVSPQGAGVGDRPPPMRHYNGQQGPPNPGPPGRPSVEKRKSEPVTQYELERLRNAVRGAPNDFKTQLTLVKKLAEAATVLADAGGLVTDARTKSKNREKFVGEAVKNLKKLIGQGYPEAMFYMADSHSSGNLGLENDPKEAFSLYQSAAKLGHAQSAYRTAVCCEMGAEDGGGTRRDLQKAVQWYRRAAQLGDTAGMYKVGMISMKGLLQQPKNMGEAVMWLKKAAERADEQNPHALHELGLLYEGLNGTGIQRDDRFAFDYFKRAADLGYKFSQYRLGQAFEFEQVGCPRDARQSIQWYTRAAKQEEHQSELALSGWYLTGAPGILEQSDTEAYLWARKASTAEPPLGKAMFAMGYYTEVGIGCPRSLEEAKRWYARSAAYKFPRAQARLEELKKGGQKAQKSRERLSRSDRRAQDENCVVM